MKLVAAVLILTAGSALAQYRGFARSHAPVSGFGSRSGFGNVVFPGGRPPVGSITDPGFALRLGATVAGTLPYRGLSHGHGRGGRGVVYMPYVWPAYGGYMNPFAEQQPNVIVIQQPPAAPVQQQTPQVVINNYADSKPYEPVSTYQAPARQAVTMDAAPSYYLIAFKDHTIYSAVAYWVEGETLHYVTAGNVRNQASLGLIDTETTERLNKDRNVSVQLK